ncbi:type IV secretory system conjugative DNA transfer family protein [Iamia sp. SCSIO 61187]|uniref:type IV secretory system conjugative DNA transfer family protein n=1 Tax=Iamia sp. SCSIO 61187 TaxID=2722752 RepID=UPI001C630C79|nr:type IV secretory system conjugative DNA transfer family protein [Iamia sp. SCSIO 61187]QYG91805.1 type IV secretory system conjugative DNA transfer family protein [Iamia sp. SCSIO 61187]
MFEVLVLVLAGVAVLVIGVVWAGAALSLLLSGSPQGVAFSAAADAVGRLPANLGAPASAWAAPYSEALPAAPLYWLSTGLAGAGAATATGAAISWFGRSKVGTSRRRPLGVDARPRFATRRDLRALLVDEPVHGRFVVAKFGRHLVATEPPPIAGGAPPPKHNRGPRRGDRGAVALVGPSRSGKTTAAVAGILEWNGPAVLSSVKADLLGATHGWRSEVGEVRVYDPMSSSIPRGTTALWSPLQQAGSVAGAQRAARALCDAAPRSGVEGGMDFWLAQAEILLSGLLFIAHQGHRDMGAVCQWVFAQDRPTDAGDGEGPVKTSV